MHFPAVGHGITVRIRIIRIRSGLRLFEIGQTVAVRIAGRSGIEFVIRSEPVADFPAVVHAVGVGICIRCATAEIELTIHKPVRPKNPVVVRIHSRRIRIGGNDSIVAVYETVTIGIGTARIGIVELNLTIGVNKARIDVVDAVGRAQNTSLQSVNQAVAILV